MIRNLVNATAAAALLASPIAAGAVNRKAQPVSDENTLAGQGTLLFLAGIAIIALAVAVMFCSASGARPADASDMPVRSCAS